MAEYDGAVAAAGRLIRQKGRTVTLRRYGAEGAVKTWRGTPTPSDTVTLKAVFTDFSTKEIDGEIIKRGDKKLLVAAEDASSKPIEKFDDVLDGAVVWKIKSVNTVAPGDQAIMYEIHARR